MPRESRSGGDAACFSLNYLPSVSLRRVKPWSYAPRGNSPAVLRLTVSCPDGRAAPAPDLKRSGQGGPRACAAAVHRGPPSNEKPRVGARGCSARRHGGVWGAAPRFLSGTISSDTPAAYYTLVCGVSFSRRSVASKAHRRPFNERREPGREQTVHLVYSGVGKIRILDRWTAMRAALKAPQR